MKSSKRTNIISFLKYISNVTGSTILLLVLGHFIIGMAVSIHRSTEKNKKQIVSEDIREILPVYDNYPEYKYYWREFNNAWGTRFEPYYHWRRNFFNGKYINIANNGTRASTLPKNTNTQANIFIFGGSTTWGTGAIDKHTIPSFLQQKINQSGLDFRVTNYGESGFVSTQELNLLLQQLAHGNIPDTVIFYDGVNDGYAGVYSPAIPRDVQNLRIKYKREKKENILLKIYNFSNYKKLINYLIKNKKWDTKVSSKIKKNSRSTIKFYEEHIRQVKALGKEYGFKTFFFWQPNLFSSKGEKVLPYEEVILQEYSATLKASQQQVYKIAKSNFLNRESENIFFLGDVFSKNNKPIFIDWSHLGPDGNKIIATKIFNSIFTNGLL